MRPDACTSEPPNQPVKSGWYWWRERIDDDPQMAYFDAESTDGNIFTKHVCTRCDYVERIGGIWIPVQPMVREPDHPHLPSISSA